MLHLLLLINVTGQSELANSFINILMFIDFAQEKVIILKLNAA